MGNKDTVCTDAMPHLGLCIWSWLQKGRKYLNIKLNLVWKNLANHITRQPIFQSFELKNHHWGS